MVASVPYDPSSRARALEATLRPLLDLFEAACGVRAAFFADVHGPGAARYAFARDGGIVETPAERPAAPARCATPAAAAALRASAGLRAPDGRELGTLDVASLSGTPLPARATEVLDACARVVAALLCTAPRASAPAAPAPGDGAALLDPLTGLPNRRALALELDRMLARAQRDDMAVFVVCLGLAGTDGMRGSVAFDRRVAELAACLSDGVRGGDVVARTGQHEFAVAGSIARGMAEAGAAVVLERLGARCACIGDRARLDMGFALAGIGAFDAQALLAEAEASLLG
jgi:diguanylate cyclase